MANRILLTNDDGSRALGLTSLISSFPQGDELFVVAPRRNQSGVGQHISLRTPLRAVSMLEIGGRWMARRPTACTLPCIIF